MATRPTKFTALEATESVTTPAATLTAATITTATVTTANMTTATADTLTVTGRKVVYSVTNVVSLTELNAGKVILADAAGVTIKPIAVRMHSTGSFAVCDALVLSDTHTSPVAIATVAVAALTDGADIFENTANVTLGAGFNANLTAGKGLKVTKTGSAATTGTSVTVTVLYTI